MPDLDSDRLLPLPDVPRGDAACWLGELCPDCGALTEPRGATCWNCGAEPVEEQA